MKTSVLSIGARMALGVGAVVVLLLTLAGVSLYSLRALGEMQDELATVEMRRLEHLSAFQGALDGMVLELHNYVVGIAARQTTWIAEAHQTYSQQRQAAANVLSKLKDLARTPQQQQDFDALRSLAEDADRAHEAMQRAVSSNELEAALAVVERQIDPMENRAEPLFLRIRNDTQAATQELDRRTDTLGRRNRWITAVIAILAVVAGLATLYLVRLVSRELRGIAGTLDVAAQQVASAAEELSTSSRELAASASQQAAALQETAASSNEVLSTANNNRAGAQQAGALAAESHRQSAAATESVHQLNRTMTTIQESTTKITGTLKAIDEIAFKTGILALNATVESARAGEAGVGFAVVAGQVRNLAERTTEAARSTSAVISESNQAVGGGIDVVHEVGEAMQSFLQTTQKLEDFVSAISLSSDDQVRGVQDMHRALSEMEKVAHQTATAAEESNAASRELTEQASQVAQRVSELRRIVNGSRG